MSQLEQAKEFALSVDLGVGRHAKDFDWVAKNIPCQIACPAKTDVPGYLEAVTKGDYAEAYRINLIDNVFPAVLGRVCTRPCEPACRHGWEGLGDPVAICFAKRSADDFMSSKEPVVLQPIFPATGKTVVVIGAGPAGLTVARQLVLWGHAVTLFDKKSYAGGNMTDAIPDFRLPRDVVEREIAQVLACGIELKLGVEIGVDRSLADLEDAFDAVIVSSGTLDAYIPDVPGVDLGGVEHGVDFLKGINLDAASAPSMAGEQVVVIGGGFTAVDCVRVSKRLDAAVICMYYRRTHAEMFISDVELDELRSEGISYEFQVAPLSFNGEKTVESVTFVRTKMVAAKEGERAEPCVVEGREFTVPADRVFLGTGQSRTKGFPLDPSGKRFVTGDFSTGAMTLVHAIGKAKECAVEVDRFLMGHDRHEEEVLVEKVLGDGTGRTREMDGLPREEMPVVFHAERGLLTEVEKGLEEEKARIEASRCYLCNYKFEIDNDLCIYCDQCLKVMPVENCIVRVSSLAYDEQDRITGYTESTSPRDYNHLYLDQNECIRCNACVEVCPVDCITLQKVTLKNCVSDKLNG